MAEFFKTYDGMCEICGHVDTVIEFLSKTQYETRSMEKVPLRIRLCDHCLCDDGDFEYKPTKRGKKK